MAKRMGNLFESLGLLASNTIHICSASDFVTGYVGQAGNLTRKVFEKGLGGVLFIDEAYRLNPKYSAGGGFMSEVVDEIVQLLTEDTFKGKMVVILAGYEAEIDDLMKTNPGLKSRFSQRLFFPDFSAEDASQIFLRSIKQEYELELSPKAQKVLVKSTRVIKALPGWSNARDMETWSKRTFDSYSRRIFSREATRMKDMNGKKQVSNLVTVEDLEEALKSVVESKKSASPVVARDGGSNESFPAPQTSFGMDDPILLPTAPSKIVSEQSDEPVEGEPEIQIDDVDGGVKDEIWAALEEACGELGYTPNQVADMLRRGPGQYNAPVLDLVCKKSGCSDLGRIIPLLDIDRPSFLSKIETLIKVMEQQKSEEEAKIQMQLRSLGVCPMNFQWLKVDGGWRCAGGSHFMSEGHLK